ncbi:hypothetical protein M406DRAFT_247646 [Cryphonectria parasitica EP155]|uniref:Uncharacterized protein n=1 Tax=Cryphonectria parasitica (strain ATCC 38755 / EP155) TaxID=660469 RepID=A0A9P5CSU2_CRYP1|nr:uncharacterized protein M406DRAFT_247646 [Cryphonectria parasitica EP155]KAF3769638.1 hypothetical protein M406DRAFT_247646 [Cryphonectria parasitica EP155]
MTNPRVSDDTSSPSGTGGPPPRQRQDRPERTTQRYRVPEQRQPASSTLDGLEYGLNNANTQLRALLEYTNTSITSPLTPSLHIHTAQHDQAEDSRRAKRRKLDCDRPGSTFKGFRYGRFGQVEPGQLKMEIHSCDGGVYEDNANNPPENILMNNDGVYCSKKDSCNIVLRHQGATVFTLTELIIRAPGPKFSAPVREGLVFVSMATDELFTRTAQYKVKYVLAPEPRSSNAERDPAPILSVRHNEDGTTITRLHQQPTLARFELHYKTAVFPAEPLGFPVTIATDCSDPEDNVPHPRLRGLPHDVIGMMPFESDSSEDEENNVNAWDDIRFDDEEDFPQQPTPPRRSHGLTLAEVAEASQLATQEAVQAVGGKLLRPHAKFFIEKGKNRCTIKFDPPVTGRFILLKMYHPSDNIDIQGVYAKGFAGPRYFPSLELR